ncbi:MAG TPA: hypothetical protein PLW68_11715 [Casimicrobiaceae bacterium]|nr:hypothetical protein [Casimicrobiaceae bacterium]
MSLRLLRSLVAMLLLCLAASSQATITVYTSKAAFLAAITAPGTDDFNNFGLASVPSPINRSAGPYSYTGLVSTTSFYGAGTAADNWLSTNTATDTITINALPATVRGIGGYFFGSDISGNFAAGNITLAATDGSGTVTQTITGATTTSFLGFVSNGPLTSMTITSVQPGSGFLWPTVNDLVMGTAAAPPVLLSASLRKVHGVAGTFDLPLSLNPLAPSTESRTGPSHTVVFTFDKHITFVATATIPEGTATLVGATNPGNEVVVDFTGMPDKQYVTFMLNTVTSADGGTLPSVSVRAGFLFGDVNQSRQVTVADVGIVNGSLLQPVSIANFFRDVNVDGKLTVADKGLTNSVLLNKLPTP